MKKSKNCCCICEKEIMVSCPYIPELCIVCGNGVVEMVRATKELEEEMARGYAKGDKRSQGVPVEEVAVRMELNRLRIQQMMLH